MSYQRATGGRRNNIGARMAGDTLIFTACSEHIARMGRAWGGTWIAIHNFVDVNFYRYSPHVDVDAPLVFLSRVEEIKGAHIAIRIARESGRRLVIAGNRVNSAEGQRYWSQEIEPFLEKGYIEYIGPVNDAQKNVLLGGAAALVVPIQWDEPFGIVFAEALACGTPVIACARGALPEIVQDGKNGFLIENTEEGVAAVHALSGIDRRTCRRVAEDRFSSHVATNAYLSLYRRVVASAGSGE